MKLTLRGRCFCVWIFLFFTFLAPTLYGQISENWRSFKGGIDGDKIKVVTPEDYRFCMFSVKLNNKESDIPMYRVWVEGESSNWERFYKDDHLNSSLVFRSIVYKEKVEYIEFQQSDFLDFSIKVYSPSTHFSSTILSRSSSDTCSCPMPTFIDRDVWCQSDCPLDTSPEITMPTHLIVHHTADVQFNDSSTTNYNDVMTLYYNNHTGSNGWDDIGYNWLIDPTGKIYKGRASGLKGSHFSCMNDNTVGIALIGNYENEEPNPVMIESLQALLTWEVCDKGIGIVDEHFQLGSELELKRLVGHKDGNQSTAGCPVGTLCPGELVYNKLDSLLQSISTTSCLIDSTKDIYYDFAANNTGAMAMNPGDEVLLAASLKSYGNGFDSLKYTIGIYLSLDDSLETSDVLLTTDSILFEVDSLGYPYIKQLIIPNTIAPGNYHVIMYIDHLQNIIELDENNNQFAFEINLEYPLSNQKEGFNKEQLFYPNPSSGALFFSSLVTSFELIDSRGRIIKKGTRKRISTRDLSCGSYYLKLDTKKGTRVEKLIIVL